MLGEFPSRLHMEHNTQGINNGRVIPTTPWEVSACLDLQALNWHLRESPVRAHRACGMVLLNGWISRSTNSLIFCPTQRVLTQNIFSIDGNYSMNQFPQRQYQPPSLRPQPPSPQHQPPRQPSRAHASKLAMVKRATIGPMRRCMSAK